MAEARYKAELNRTLEAIGMIFGGGKKKASIPITAANIDALKFFVKDKKP